ncbi:TPA_asm: hypothetical protein [Altiarchaeum virus]|nr:TPA_asm: hypothetical protein [Altiarchaeum virus]
MEDEDGYVSSPVRVRYVYKIWGTELNAIVEMSKKGQNDIDESDEVVVLCKLYLPTKTDNKFLNDEIRFGERIGIFDENLYDNWGKECEGEYIKYRCNDLYFVNKKWEYAYRKAKEHVEKEISLLCKAVKQRMEALATA